MCGIFAIYHQPGAPRFDIAEAKKLSSRQAHRGPDFRGHWQCARTGNVLCHERLAIMDLGCQQPIAGSAPDRLVIHNGEIYNHATLRDGPLAAHRFQTTCDSEAIIWLYEKLRCKGAGQFEAEMCNQLDGVFAFVVVHGPDEFMVARDPIGVKPLYYGKDSAGHMFFSSEMKVFEDVADVELHAFPPGHFFTPAHGIQPYYRPAWRPAPPPLGAAMETYTPPASQPAAAGATEQQPPDSTDARPDFDALRDALIAATEKRLMTDAPIAVLLSGGLDSSLVSAIACRALRAQGQQKVHSFSVGLDADCPDLVAARRVAAFLGTEHHEVLFSVDEGLQMLDRLIWHLEAYDVTTIRASTPMYFLSKKIAELGFKVVLSGEGADEIFGGYLYFHNAPSDEEFQRETIRRVSLLSTADCLRADKSCMANHIEVRVPFLDKRFLDVAVGLDARWKRPRAVTQGGRNVEKWVIRKAFDDKENPFIPSEILWRQKEQFSDGVGYGWIDQLVEHCAAHVTDEQMSTASVRFPYNPPQTKEAYFIRATFARHYPSADAAKTVLRWIPKWQSNTDPSGRASDFHEQRKTTSAKCDDATKCRGLKHENGVTRDVAAAVVCRHDDDDDDDETGEPPLKKSATSTKQQQQPSADSASVVVNGKSKIQGRQTVAENGASKYTRRG